MTDTPEATAEAGESMDAPARTRGITVRLVRNVFRDDGKLTAGTEIKVSQVEARELVAAKVAEYADP